MPKLYVANATHHVLQFAYWLPETPRYYTQEIPIGSQVQVAGRELPQTSIDGILEQHRQYGLVPSSEAARTRNWSGVSYSVDKPVPLSVLQDLVNRYRGLLTAQGRQLRSDAAIATNEFIDDQMFREQVPGRLEKLEMSVEEVSRDQRDDTPEVSEGVRVLRTTPDGPAPRTQLKRPSRRQSERAA